MNMHIAVIEIVCACSVCVVTAMPCCDLIETDLSGGSRILKRGVQCARDWSHKARARGVWHLGGGGGGDMSPQDNSNLRSSEIAFCAVFGVKQQELDDQLIGVGSKFEV